MDGSSTELFTTTLALIGAVIVIAALLSGLIERSGFPQVAAFLALGAILGTAGLGLLDITLESPILRAVATLSLVLVLFTDALSLNIGAIRRHATLVMRVLGPGTLLSAALIALAGWWLLGLSPAAAAILGAALASTDPVLLHGLLREPFIPDTVRLPLRLESGLNDGVLLPVVLVAMMLLQGDAPRDDLGWAHIGLDLFVLGPGAGVVVGLLSIAALDMVRRKLGVRRDYESLYSLGVVFGAYAAAEALHASGFLAAFAAGLTIAALDVELCDCFLEYGETTAEMTLLFTFILFGSSLIWSGLGEISGATLLFALVALFVRPVAFLVSLGGARLNWRERAVIAWFGPRGLSSLLLVLLPVFAGLPGSERLFALCSLVVLLSVVVHGGSLMLLGRRVQRRKHAAALANSDETAPLPDGNRLPVLMEAGQASAVANPSAVGGERITIEQLRELRQAGAPVFVIDSRGDRAYASADLQARGAVRLAPNDPVQRVADRGVPRHAWLAVLCECPNEETSLAVAQRLRQAGWPLARALQGGWKAWQASDMPVEPKATGPNEPPRTGN